MRFGLPLIFREKYFAPIEAETQHIFDQIIYSPLTRILFGKEAEEVFNTASAVVAAINEERIWYSNGIFEGQFSADISREIIAMGGKFNRLSNYWVIPKGNVPPEVSIAQAGADARLADVRRKMVDALSSIDLNGIDGQGKTDSEYKRTLGWMEEDFYKTVSAITIVPTFTQKQKDMIAREWSQNLELYIKGWAGENILKLRQEVQEHALAGGRSGGLVKMLQQNYGTSKAKAKFLARQETSLLLSKYKESRYADIGIQKYKWSTSHDERVRPDHAALNGKIFLFSSPPITNRKTGARNNPGEDFGCRCSAVPVVD